MELRSFIFIEKMKYIVIFIWVIIRRFHFVDLRENNYLRPIKYIYYWYLAVYWHSVFNHFVSLLIPHILTVIT